MRKSQSSIEFIVLVAFMFLVVVVFFGFTTNKIGEAAVDSNVQVAEDLANIAYQEIAL